MKWLKIAVAALLLAVLLLFALIGYLGSTRGTPTRAVLTPGDSAGPPASGDTVFLGSIRSLTGTELRAGHTVEPLYDGNGTYPRLWQDLRAAQRHALIQLYYCKPGVVADSFKHVLRDVAQKGV